MYDVYAGSQAPVCAAGGCGGLQGFRMAGHSERVLASAYAKTKKRIDGGFLFPSVVFLNKNTGSAVAPLLLSCGGWLACSTGGFALTPHPSALRRTLKSGRAVVMPTRPRAWMVLRFGKKGSSGHLP